MKKQAHMPPATLANKITTALVSYVKTQFLLVIIVTTVSYALLWTLNVRFALALSLFTGSLSIVPFWGTTIAAIIVSLVAIFDGIAFLPSLPVVMEGITIASAYILLNIFVDYILAPYMNAKTIHIHPLLLLIIIVLATGTFGLAGAVLAVPTTLVVKIILEHSNS